VVSEPPPAAALAAALRAHFPGETGPVRLAPIGTGKHNASYWVEGLRGPDDRLVLRVAPPDGTGLLFYERRMMRHEPALHALIRARTDLPVAEVVANDFSRARLDRDYLLLAVLPGRPLSDLPRLGRRERADVLRRVGAALRRLHRLTAPEHLAVTAYGYLGAHRPLPPQPTWEGAFRAMWHRLLDDVVAAGCYDEAEARGLRDLYERHRACFDRPVAASLLHMDVWAQNILVEPAGGGAGGGLRLSGLVDFDRALWGDPEIEFAVLDYCGISEPPFWDGYGLARDVSPAADVRRRFYLLYEL
jgi:aminoglycoside phosphotransferase (APT) family kinase protein